MDVPTLIVLGAAGGALRGLLEVYTRFLDWQTDRRGYRQARDEGEPPRFREYFDPGVESVAALLHSGMGAGAAVLFGTTGQISGAYAAIVVGLSAPVLLTQLSRVQAVGDALTGVPPQPPMPAAEVPQPPSAPADPAQTSGEPVAGRPRFEPRNGRPVTHRDIEPGRLWWGSPVWAGV